VSATRGEEELAVLVGTGGTTTNGGCKMGQRRRRSGRGTKLASGEGRSSWLLVGRGGTTTNGVCKMGQRRRRSGRGTKLGSGAKGESRGCWWVEGGQ